ncbi:hypothetical protein [Streptomyces antimicrobicus]|uniref:Uncharacterized protein n=1 Tax=Streptomyces antimicrobicus TaxID=2883108 RepID=A0ABS8B4J5_9ACTN|nr:hypothetical protein [Streptomyces antimicrobicus]MCB5179493.1 hypothetical protein [Streptomyces antimicrobicus]
MLTDREARGAVMLMERAGRGAAVAKEVQPGTWAVMLDGQDVSLEAGKLLIEARAAGQNI